MHIVDVCVILCNSKKRILTTQKKKVVHKRAGIKYSPRLSGEAAKQLGRGYMRAENQSEFSQIIKFHIANWDLRLTLS